ncbi:MAG TPA: O-antigen ligase family protein [Gemmatimonadales bacterium]|nr:O-antigen ligase family protein [Gemmatimonadales bacterium]
MTIAARLAYGAPPSELSQPDVKVHPLVRAAFYLFVFSLPFEYPKRTIPWEVTTITCAVFLGTAFLQPRVSLARLPWAVRLFGIYLYVLLGAFVLDGGHYGEEVQKLFILLLEAVLLLWTASNLLRFENITRTALLTLGIACILRAAIQLAGIATVRIVQWTGGVRVMSLGQNENHSAMIMTGGVIALLGLAYGRSGAPLWARVVTWPCVGVIAVAIVQNGSRGGMLGLGAGLLALSFGGASLTTRVRNAAVVLLALGLLVWGSFQFEGTRNRFLQTAETGFTAGRERIFPTALRMFAERPLTGWGPLNNMYELGNRLPEQHVPRRDTHNLVLEVATATGLLGFVPFAIGTWLCVAAAWRARKSVEGTAPFALLTALLATNMSGNWVATPLLWLTFAYALAGGRRPPVVT